jgi:hypothetical protein
LDPGGADIVRSQVMCVAVYYFITSSSSAFVPWFGQSTSASSPPWRIHSSDDFLEETLIAHALTAMHDLVFSLGRWTWVS